MGLKSIIESEIDKDTVVGTAVINMYGKCGSIREARSVFEPLRSRDLILWNTMLAVYAQNGQVSDAIDSLEQMLSDHICPDEITFVCLLTACSHAGCLDTGKYLFGYMNIEYRIPWMRDHYGCMVDLLGRAGLLSEAEDLIDNMPEEPTIATWMSLLGACRHQTDLNRAERAANNLFLLDPISFGPRVMLYNMYTLSGIVNTATWLINEEVSSSPSLV